MNELTATEKYAIVCILYQIMNADGIIHPKEEEFMNKAYIELGININDIEGIANMNEIEATHIIQNMSSPLQEYAHSLFVSMAASDGYIHPDEAAIIDKLFK